MKNFEEFLKNVEIYLDPHKYGLDKEEWQYLGGEIQKRIDEHKNKEPKSKWKQLKLGYDD